MAVFEKKEPEPTKEPEPVNYKAVQLTKGCEVRLRQLRDEPSLKCNLGFGLHCDLHIYDNDFATALTKFAAEMEMALANFRELIAQPALIENE